MAVTLTAALVGTAAPCPVQVLLNGTTAGQTYLVTGSTGASTWTIPGGSGISTGAQVILADTRSALNTPVTYTAVVAGVTYTSAPVTVSYGGRAVLQSLDGQRVVPVQLGDNADPRELELMSVVLTVPGRRRPPVRYMLGGDGGGELALTTVGAATIGLEELLLLGGPVVLRTDGTVLPLRPAVDLLQPTRAGHQIVGASTQWGDKRRWALPYILVDDPEPSTPVASFNWDDFDTPMLTRTWTNFDTIFAGMTWDQFDTYDWSQL